MPVMVKALGYYSHKSPKGITKVKQHLKYLEYGKQHEREPEGFTDRDQPLSRNEFMERVREQPERGVIAHKLVFSLSQEERDRGGIDMRELVQETMAQWSQSLGRPLRWIGFEHEDRGHPHVHVVVAGYAEGKQVNIFERDIRQLREWSEREKTRQVERSLPEREQPSLVREIERLFRGVMERDREHDRGR